MKLFDATSYAATNAIGGVCENQPLNPRCATRVDAGGSNNNKLPSTTIIVACSDGEKRVKSFGPRIAHSDSRTAITAT